MPQVHTVEFTAPFRASITPSTLPAAPPPGHVQVTTLVSLVSAGTELLAYRGEMPTSIPADALFASHAAPFSYPCAYGYAAVGSVSAVAPDVSSPAPGDLVFAFREHASRFVEPAHSLHRVPAAVAPEDAAFLPIVETALSLAMDAALLPGEAACVVGQGPVGLLLVAVLNRIHPYSRVVALDINEERRRISSQRSGADAALDPSADGFMAAFATAIGDHAGADVTVDVSGVGVGLDTAIRTTRDHGRVVIGSWFGTKHVSLASLGGRFHRSHLQLVASQVSHIPPALSGRWSKERRLRLAWEVLADLRPSQCFPVHKVHVHDAPKAYEELASAKHLQVMFQYNECASSQHNNPIS